MFPSTPPSPEEKRRAMARVASLRAEARRRQRRRRFALGGVTATAAAAIVVLSAWLVPSHKPSTVRVLSPSPTSTSTASTTPSTTHGSRSGVPLAGPFPPSLVYSGGGVVAVGVTPYDAFSGGYAQLFLSTDLVHWKNITPPQSHATHNGTWPLFQQASFLNPSTGWVTTWNPATTKTIIYRTSDGGSTWTSIPGSGHSANAGAETLIDLVSPTAAFEEQLEPTAPRMSLSVTTNAGQSWKTVYTGPPPTPANGRYQGPFMMPMTFTDTQHGFAATGLPPTEGSPGEADFFHTTNGGSTWTRQAPPLPATALTCPATVNTSSATSCIYSLPVFTDSRHGAIAAVVSSGGHAQVAFDTTSDGGQHWTKTSQLTTTATNPQPGSPQPNRAYPLISISPSGSWWVLGSSGTTAITQVTSNHGTTSATNRATLPPGTPTSLNALNSTHALLTINSTTPNGTTTKLFTTQDGGQHWTILSFP